MIRSINSKYFFLALAGVLIFGATCVLPTSASANYSHGDEGYGFNPYGSPLSNHYGYNRPSPPVIVEPPVYIQQPPVYISQPQPVYVPQTVYVSQSVYVQQPTVYYNPISVSCSANATFSNNGSVVWTAYVSGGNNSYYDYSWSGSDGISGSGRSISYNYSTSGQKYAAVTVYSNGQTITQNCSNTVSVSITYYPYQSNYQNNNYSAYAGGFSNSNSNNLDIGCYVDPTNAKVNQPITWSAEATGGVGPYTYSWTGSDDLTGSGSSIIKYYSKTGSKSAIVTVTSANGFTGTKACSNAITIGGEHRTSVGTAKSSSVSNQVSNNISTNSLFSLANVPWGWVAILIIIFLFFTVIYLLFNKHKI